MVPVNISDEKAAIRQRIWQQMYDSRVGRGKIFDHIPDFVGSDQAAARLAELPQWQAARTVMCNPDRAQQPVRALALAAGKLLFMAVPGLAKKDPFYRLDPAVLGDDLERAADRRVAAELAPTVAVRDMPVIDFVVCGSVAVDRCGVRIGKGAGYSDREIAILAEANLLGSDVLTCTTVHELQIVEEALPQDLHDVAMSYLVTPLAVLPCRSLTHECIYDSE